MLKLRLTRTGGNKEPSYRVVVARARSKRDGRPVDSIGHYNPRTKPETIVMDIDKAEYWISRGAHPTETVKRLMKKLKSSAYAAAQLAEPLSAPSEQEGEKTSAEISSAEPLPQDEGKTDAEVSSPTLPPTESEESKE